MFEDATRDAKSPGLPTLEQRAAAAPITAEIYDFAYRGESSAPHGHMRALIANLTGEPPLSKRLMLHNMVVSAMCVFAAAADICGSRECKQAADQLQETIRERVKAESAAAADR